MNVERELVTAFSYHEFSFPGLGVGNVCDPASDPQRAVPLAPCRAAWCCITAGRPLLERRVTGFGQGGQRSRVLLPWLSGPLRSSVWWGVTAAGSGVWSPGSSEEPAGGSGLCPLRPHVQQERQQLRAPQALR